MKKKTGLIIGACVVVAAAIAIAVFLFQTRDMQGNDNNTSFAGIVGTWQVFSHNPDPTNSESPFILVEDQYLVFSETSIHYYVAGSCVLTADYTSEDSRLKLANVDTTLENFPSEFVFEQIAGSNDYIKLIDEIVIRDWQLIRNAGDGENPAYVDPNSIEGEWNVVLHGANKVADERIVFDTTKGTMTDYRPSGETTLTYTWMSEDRVVFAEFGEFVFCNVSENRIAMIQLNDHGNVWMLERAK